MDTELSDRGGKGLAAREAEEDGGGANPLPLPKIRPPPSLRPDIVTALENDVACECVGRSWFAKHHSEAISVKGGELWTRRPVLVELRLELQICW